MADGTPTSQPRRQPPKQPRNPPTAAQAAAVAAVLAGAGTAAGAAGGAGVMAGLLALMVPWGFSGRTIRAVVTITTRTAGTIRPAGVAGGATFDAEPEFSAWFLLNAATRVEQRLAEGKTLEDALRPERRHLEQRERARVERRKAAAQVDEAAAQAAAARVTVNSRPVLAWRAYTDDKVTPECRAADGHWFYVDTPPVIGYPGMPHGGTCRCTPVKATPAALQLGNVDDAVRSALRTVPAVETFPTPAPQEVA